MTTARNTLLNELLAGEDPASPEYADARTRLEGLIADHRNEVLDEIREGASVDLVAEHRDQVLTEAAELIQNTFFYPTEGPDSAADLLLAARTGQKDSPTAAMPSPEAAELARLRSAVRAALVVARHGDMSDQTRAELTAALTEEG